MPLDDQAAWALLRALDDPLDVEYPRDYNYAATRARFERLAALLDQRFDCTCDVDRHIQDASHHGVIVIPATATASIEHITITISNFGSLAVVSLGNPGSYDKEEEHELLHPEDRRRIEDGLQALGYLVIPEHILWNDYDGGRDLGSRYSPQHRLTWWNRFFDYL